jgi:hypothetical protein
VKATDLARRLPQPLAVPVQVTDASGVVYDLSLLSSEELDSLRATHIEVVGAATPDVQLPALADCPADFSLVIRSPDAALNNVTITPAAGETIYGAASLVISVDGGWAMIAVRQGSSSDWYALGTWA